jgi:hypothetical protein
MACTEMIVHSYRQDNHTSRDGEMKLGIEEALRAAVKRKDALLRRSAVIMKELTLCGAVDYAAAKVLRADVEDEVGK